MELFSNVDLDRKEPERCRFQAGKGKKATPRDFISRPGHGFSDNHINAER